jgi:ketosteroid isomerase-like protein
MRKLALVVLCFVLACANRDPIQDALNTMKSHEDYVKTLNLEGVMTNMADDVVVLAIPLIVGREAIEEFYAGFFANLSSVEEFSHNYLGTEIIGNIVFLHGTATFKGTNKDGTTLEMVNNFFLVLKYQPDGRIKIWRNAVAVSSL